MKRILFLLFLFPSLSFACAEHPEASNDKPLWLQTLVSASHAHKQHKHKSKKELKKIKKEKKTSISIGSGAGSSH